MMHLRAADLATVATPEDVDLDAVNLHQIACILILVFPQYSREELVRMVAEALVRDGHRRLIWEP